MYEYTAKITSVYDGDTVTGDVDLGFGIWIKKQKFRLMGIDTPEIRTKDKDEKVRGYEARDRLRELILGKTVRIRSFGKGKYGDYFDGKIDDFELHNRPFDEAEISSLFQG